MHTRSASNYGTTQQFKPTGHFGRSSHGKTRGAEIAPALELEAGEAAKLKVAGKIRRLVVLSGTAFLALDADKPLFTPTIGSGRCT